MTLLILFVILAIGVSFLCSILEAVLLSITPSFVESAESERPALAEKLRSLRADIERPLAAILSLNTIAHTVGATGAGAQAAVVFGDTGVGIFSAVLTLGILVLSEIVPKTLGATYWRTLAPFAVRVLPWLITAQLPLVWMSQWLTRILTRGHVGEEVSREEITALTTAGARLGVVDEGETRIVENLFQLHQIPVESIMTPRTVIDAVASDETVAQVVGAREQFPYSRLPVTGESVDEIIGFVLTRELLLAHVRGEHNRTMGELAREIARVPATMDVDALMDVFTESDRHIALVEDAYGGTAGIVTMEDLLETLLGTEIVDEHDQAVDLRLLAQERAKARRAKRLATDNEPAAPRVGDTTDETASSQ